MNKLRKSNILLLILVVISVVFSGCPGPRGHRPLCGDGDTEFSLEECDEGENNGLVCVPDYGYSCEYCSNSCEILMEQGSYCGDGACDTENESIISCATDCST